MEEYNDIVAERNQVQTEKAQVEAAKAQVDALKSQLEAAKASLEAQNSALESNKKWLEENKAALETDITTKQASAAFLLKTKKQVEDSKAAANLLKMKMKSKIVEKEKQQNAKLSEDVGKLKEYVTAVEDELKVSQEVSAALEKELEMERELRGNQVASLWTDLMSVSHRTVEAAKKRVETAKISLSDSEAALNYEVSAGTELESQRSAMAAKNPAVQKGMERLESVQMEADASPEEVELAVEAA